MALRVIIDTDPGIDDAVAILYALARPQFEVLGVTTLAGNISLPTTTRNAGRLLAAMGRDLPVFSGASGPLARKGFDVADIHGNDGLGGVSLPEPLRPAQTDAVDYLARTLMAEPEGTITLLTLGPLTNLAHLIQNHPQAAARIGQVIAMGGAIHDKGNIGPKSEFNLAADPEAAEVVFASNLPITLIPLDVTRLVRANPQDCAELRSLKTTQATLCADLIEAYFQDRAGAESRPLHDPCVMLYALAPDLFETEEMGLTVDLTDGPDAGAIFPAADRPKVKVALRVQGRATVAQLIAGLA